MYLRHCRHPIKFIVSSIDRGVNAQVPPVIHRVLDSERRCVVVWIVASVSRPVKLGDTSNRVVEVARDQSIKAPQTSPALI